MDEFSKQISEMTSKIIDLSETRDRMNKSAEDYEIAIREEREEFEKQRDEHRKRIKELETEARKRRLASDQARKDLDLVNKALSNIKIQHRTEVARLEAEKNLRDSKKLKEDLETQVKESKEDKPKEDSK